MNSLYQYYNEIVLAFADYVVDFKNGTIIIEVSESNKPFHIVCEKIAVQVERISKLLEPREQDVIIQILRGNELSTMKLEKEIIV